LNNRGYGGSAGRPTEANNVADAIAAYTHLRGLRVPSNKIVAYGESLGSGQALRLAAARPVGAVVLEAPLTSTVDVVRSAYFWLPLSLLITDKYDNERNIRSVTAPILILHGEQDEVIPIEMGKRVFRAANEPKRMEVFPQGTHDDLFAHGDWEKTRSFAESMESR
jgi:fermentation-respiration switch protein FrsA (DUF1100 family)